MNVQGKNPLNFTVHPWDLLIVLSLVHGKNSKYLWIDFGIRLHWCSFVENQILFGTTVRVIERHSMISVEKHAQAGTLIQCRVRGSKNEDFGRW